MKLLIQPGDGVDRLVKGIRKAKKSVEIIIFRLDRSEIERALVEAVENGVSVRALIASTNRGGEQHLHKLEMRLLENGISVARTAGDLVRYHGKMMLVDRKELYLLAFNFTHLVIDHSRSFGLVTRNPELLREAMKLFEADTTRQPYVAGHPKFLVSPVNARKELASFVKRAKKELLIYDPEISDRAMLRALQDRRNGGVEVRVIGKVSRNRLPARNLDGLRLHTRIILRDRERDARDFPVGKTARKMAKVVGKNLSVTPVVKQVDRAIQRRGDLELRPKEVEETVKTAVKEAVKDVVKEATKEAIKTMIDDAELREADTK